MSRVDISNLPAPNQRSGEKHNYRYQFMKLEEWRKHPALYEVPKNAALKWNTLFPGFFPAVALFTTYVIFEKVLTKMGFFGDSHGHGHHHDESHH